MFLPTYKQLGSVEINKTIYSFIFLCLILILLLFVDAAEMGRCCRKHWNKWNWISTPTVPLAFTFGTYNQWQEVFNSLISQFISLSLCISRQQHYSTNSKSFTCNSIQACFRGAHGSWEPWWKGCCCWDYVHDRKARLFPVICKHHIYIYIYIYTSLCVIISL
jgi:hypothetical protein